MSRLSEILIKRREGGGFTQKEVAKLISKGLRTYQYYEEGSVTPKTGTLEKLSKALNFSLSEMYSDSAIKLHNNEFKDIKLRATLPKLATDLHENLIAINAAIKFLMLKVAEIESSTTKKGFAEVSLEMERMTQQEIKRAFEKLRTG